MNITAPTAAPMPMMAAAATTPISAPLPALGGWASAFEGEEALPHEFEVVPAGAKPAGGAAPITPPGQLAPDCIGDPGTMLPPWLIERPGCMGIVPSAGGTGQAAPLCPT